MKVVFWMTGVLVSFSLMAVGARELSGAVGVFEILFFRSLIGLAVITLLILKTKRWRLFFSNRKKLHIGRNIFHFGGQYGWFLGIGLLPLAEVFAIEFTVPVWTALIAAVFLNEALTLRKVLAILFGLLGVAVILQPGIEIIDPASFIVLGAAICYSISYVSTKSLSDTESPLTILFYMCLIQLPIGLVLVGEHWVYPSPLQWFWISIVSLTALTAHYCMARAMQVSEASVVVTLDFLRLPLITIIGAIFYAEAFHVAILIGASLMLLGNLINVYRSPLLSQSFLKLLFYK